MNLLFKSTQGNGYIVLVQNGTTFSFNINDWGDFLPTEADLKCHLNDKNLFHETQGNTVKVPFPVAKKAEAIAKMLFEKNRLDLDTFPIVLLDLLQVKKIKTSGGNFLCEAILNEQKAYFYQTPEGCYRTSKIEIGKKILLDSTEWLHLVSVLEAASLKQDAFIIEETDVKQKALTYLSFQYIMNLREMDEKRKKLKQEKTAEEVKK